MGKCLPRSHGMTKQRKDEPGYWEKISQNEEDCVTNRAKRCGLKVVEVDPKKWLVHHVLTRQAIETIVNARIVKGYLIESVMQISVKDKDQELFTLNLQNRLLGIFRKLYNEPVLLQFKTPKMAKDKEKQNILLKAARMHKAREKKYQESLQVQTMCNLIS